ncbi:hypothetical protein K9M41_00450 [Candidatus Gracilibacteria bacterium]|nr:hypothetical protein [Candidatus Gracilibacteria bacterium]
MKFLRDQYLLPENDWKSRVIFMAEERVEVVKEEEKIDDILDNLFAFSVVKLKIINERANELTETQKAKFRDIIGYYLSLNDDMFANPPRILALIARGAVPNAEKFLSPIMRKKINEILDEKKKRLQELLKKDGPSWSPKQASQVCTLYNFLRTHGVNQQGELDDLFVKVQESLLSRAIPLANRFVETEVDGKTKVAQSETNKFRPLLSREKVLLLEVYRLFPNPEDWQGKASADDRKWQGHKEEWDKVFQTLSNSIARSLLSESDPDSNDPNLSLSWEILAEWNYDHRDEEEQVNENDPTEGIFLTFSEARKREEIEKLIKRGNAVQFLKFAAKADVLTATHVKALKDIENDEGGFLLNGLAPISREKFLQEVLGRTTSESEEETQYKENLESQKKDKDFFKKVFASIKKKEWEQSFKDNLVDIVSDNKDLDDLIQKFNDLSTKFDIDDPEEYPELINSLKNFLEGNSLKDKLAEIDIVKEFLDKAKSYEDKLTESSALEDNLVNSSDLRRTKVRGTINEEKEELDNYDKIKDLLKTEKEKEVEKRKIEEGLIAPILKNYEGKKEDSFGEDESEKKEILKLVEEYQETKEAWEDSRGSAEEKDKLRALDGIRDILLKQYYPYKKRESLSDGEKEKLAKIKKLGEEIQNSRDEQNKLSNEGENSKEEKEFFTDTIRKVKEIKESFWGKLETRIKLHQIRAADLDVLWHDLDEADKLEEERDDTKKINVDEEGKTKVSLATRPEITRFRDAFVKVLDQKIEKTKNRIKSGRIMDNEEDKHAPWLFDILDDEFLYDSLATSLEREGFDITRELEGDQIRTEMVQGALQHYRNRIIQGLKGEMYTEDKFGNEKDISEEVLSAWERLHTKIDSPKEIADLDADMKVIEKSYEKSKKKIEETNQKLTAIAENIYDKKLRTVLEDYGFEGEEIEGYIKKILVNPDLSDEGVTSREGLQSELTKLLEDKRERELNDEEKKNLECLVNRVLLEQVNPVITEQYMEGYYITEEKDISDEAKDIAGERDELRVKNEELKKRRAEKEAQILAEYQQVLDDVNATTAAEDVELKTIVKEIAGAVDIKERIKLIKELFIPYLKNKSVDLKNKLSDKTPWGDKKKLERLEERISDIEKLGIPETISGRLFIPGKNPLRKAEIQTREVKQDIFNSIKPLQRDLDKIRRGYLDLSTTDPYYEKKKEALKQEVVTLLGDWGIAGRKIRLQVKEMKEVCREIFSAETLFAQTFFLSVENIINELDGIFAELKPLTQPDTDFTGKGSLFERIEDGLNSIKYEVDFRDGFWAEQSKKADERQEALTKGAEKASEFGILQEREEGKKRYETKRTEFVKAFTDYRTSRDAIKKILETDIQKMSDEDFKKKFNISKEHAREVLDYQEGQNSKFKELWEKYGDTYFIDRWLERYDKSGEERVEALIDLGKLDEVTEAMKKSQIEAKNMVEWLEEYKKTKSHGARIKWTKFSIYDIYRVVAESFEKHSQNWKRDSDQAVTAIGATVLGTGNNFLGRIGQRWKQAGEETENQRVKEYETQYETQDGWGIQRVLYRTRNKDEARACINLLSKKGFLKWDDPKLWETLNHLLGRKNFFHIPGDMDLTSEKILKKIEGACEIIWTRDYFRAWDGELESNLKRAREGFNHEFAIYENDPKARTEIMADMLKRWSQGETEKIDPAKFEGFLFESFRLGKMNGLTDQRFYFMIMGVATINPRTGQSLLSRDIFMRINGEFLARFPHVDFFADKSSPKYKGRIVPKGTPGAEERAWNFSDYLEWAKMMGDGSGTYNPKEETAQKNSQKFFFQVIHMSPYGRDRVQRMQRMQGKEGDHDDAWAPFLEWTKAQTERHLHRLSDGAEKSSADYWRTFLSAFPVYMRHMDEYIRWGDSEWGSDAGWKDSREKLLFEVGERLRVGLTVVQAFLGNYISYAQGERATIFGEDEWEKEGSDYSPSLKDSKKEINKMMEMFIDATGDTDMQKYKDILDFEGYDYGTSPQQLKGNPEWEKMNILSENVLTKEKDGGRYFRNTDVIERVLGSYSKTL